VHNIKIDPEMKVQLVLPAFYCCRWLAALRL